MVPRSGRLANPDSQGQYVRQLGWKDTASGTRAQHKFRLGSDRREAERRDDRLRQLWEQICKDNSSAEARWDDLTLAIARQIARGEDSIQLPPDTDDESAASYVYRLQRIQNRLTFLRFVAADLERYTRGIGNRAIDQRDIVLVGDSREDYWEQKCFMERYLPPPLKPETDDVVGRGDPMAQMFSQPYRPLSQPQDDGATLHQAFDAYKTWIREYYTTDTAGTLSEHGYTKLGQIDTLKGHHTDARLSEIDLDFIEKMYRYCGSGP